MTTLKWYLVVLVLLFTCVWVASAEAPRYEPETLYETFPWTTVPDISKPRIYIDRRGRAYETFKGTSVPDLSKPMYAPKRAQGGRYEKPNR